MCSCVFYPLHLVYSGLIWIFGVRVNYISKLFLHFYIYILASPSCSLLIHENTTRSRFVMYLPFLKLNRIKTCIHRFSTSPITKTFQFYQFFTDRHSSDTFNTPQHTFQHIRSAYEHGYFATLTNHSCTTKKEMSVLYRELIYVHQLYRTLQYVDISFFSLSSSHIYPLWLYYRANT